MAGDVSRDPVLAFLDRHNWLIGGSLFLLLYVVGYGLDGPEFGLSLFLWGGCFRTAYGWHSTFIVNSICHMHGYCNYQTSDGSRNSWLGAILAQGEAWHNNHHALPRSAAHGHRRFEFDPVYLAEHVGTAPGQGTLDQYYQDGSFAKLREVSVTYTVPPNLLGGYQSASLTVAGRDLHTWTNYAGIDPEVNVNNIATSASTTDQAVTPPLSRFIVSLNLKF